MEEEWGSSGTDRRVVRKVASGEHLGEKWSSCIVGGHVELEAEADSGVPGCGGGWTAVFTTWDTCILGLVIIPDNMILRTVLPHWR